MASVPNSAYPVHEAAEALARLGVSTIPILSRTKEPPVGFRWGEYATRLADASERYTWFVERGHQVAVVAGPVSGHLVVLDYDGATGFETHAAQYPILRRYPRVETGSGKHHVWVRVSRPTQKYDTRLGDGSKLEIRANTHYTVCPPSIHPCGQPYRWIIDPWQGIPVIDLATVGLQHRPIHQAPAGQEFDEGTPLTEQEQATLVRLVTPHYLPDHRHDLCLALAGYLVNLEVAEASARTVVETLAQDHGDDKRLSEYRRAVRDTYAKARTGVAVQGWARLTDGDDPLISPAIAKQVDLLFRSRSPQWTFEPVKKDPRSNAAPTDMSFEGKGITLAELQHKEFAPLRWVVEGMIPEGALLLCGRPKSRKSWLALGLAIAVALGGLALGSKPTIPGRVLYLDLEGNQQRIKKRAAFSLGSHGTPWPERFHLFTAGEWPTGMDGLRQLEQWFITYPDTILVIVDVLQDFRPPIGPKENAYDYDRNTLKEINQLAERRHAVIILIHHTRKAKGEDALDEVSGTLGAPSAVATIWILSRATDGIHTILRPRGRDLFDEEDQYLAWDVLSGGFQLAGPAESVKQSEERKAVLEYLADDGEHPLKDIAAALNKSTTATSHLLSALAAEGKVEKVRYGTYARTQQR